MDRVDPCRRSARRLVALALAGALAVLAGCARTPAPPGSRSAGTAPSLPLLSHEGRFLTDAAGQVVIVHGFDMVAKRPPYEPSADGFGATSAAALAANGFSVVRLGVIYAALEPTPGTLSSSYLDSIAATVRTLARAGVYTLLDFHQDQLATEFGGEGFPAWSVETGGLPVRRYPFPLGYTESAALDVAFDRLYENRPGPGGVGLATRYADAWEAVAARFAGDPAVLGYDLMNEPWPAHSSDAAIGRFFDRQIAAVRSVDRRHLVFYEPDVLFDFGVPTSLPPLRGGGLAMSFHDYCLGAASSASCAHEEAGTVHNALARSAATGDGLLMTEFGATRDLRTLARVAGDADRVGLGWTEWAWCGCGDPTGTVPPSIEGLVADPARPATGRNVDRAVLDLLAEPYPRLTAGTPGPFAFDAGTRRFTYRFSTLEAGGTLAPAGSCSAVVIAPEEYPTGYRVEVTGARVTSHPDAGVLTLASTARPSGGPATVSVVLLPASHGRVSPPAQSALAACR